MPDGTGALPSPHSPLGASSAERWMNCSGSVALIQALRASGTFEEDDPDYRRDGTQAHALAAFCLERGVTAGEALLDAEWDALDMEMVSAVQVYLDYCNALPGRHYAETRVQRPEFHPDFYGTLDFAAVSVSGEYVEFVDYKHGAGVLVEAEDNVQLRYYAYGEIAEDTELYPDAQTIKLTICQPRIEHPDGSIRSDLTTAGALRAWAHEVLRPAMDRTLNERFLSMGEWCRFCPAKIVCPAMLELSKEMIAAEPAVMMSDEGLADLYVKVEQIKMLAKAVTEEVRKRMVEKQRELPGLKVVYAKVNRVWKPEGEAALTAEFGDAAYAERKLRSPAQVEDNLGDRGKELVAEHAYKPQGGYTVAPIADKRTAVKVETPEERHAGILAYAEAAQ